MSRFPRIPVTVLAVVAAAAFHGEAAAANVGCGDEVWSSVTLQHDLVCAGDGLSIAGSDLVVDLNGHSITGSGDGHGIVLGGDGNVTIANGKISHFLRGMVIHEEVGNTTITNLVIADNTDVGVTSISYNSGFTFEKNMIVRNGGDGMRTGYAFDAAVYDDNVFAHNGGNGLYVENSTSTIVNNRFRDNGVDGLFVFEEVPGFYEHYRIRGNVADRNTDLGIRVLPAFDGELPQDVGGNAAKHNGDPRQCLNIQCARNRGLARFATLAAPSPAHR
jgi:hypothetical protein